MALDKDTLDKLEKIAQLFDRPQTEGEGENAGVSFLRLLKKSGVPLMDFLNSASQVVQLSQQNAELAEAVSLLEEELQAEKEHKAKAPPPFPGNKQPNDPSLQATVTRLTQQVDALTKEKSALEAKYTLAQKDSDVNRRRAEESEKERELLYGDLMRERASTIEFTHQGRKFFDDLLQRYNTVPRSLSSSGGQSSTLKSIFSSVIATHDFFEEVTQHCQQICDLMKNLTDNGVNPKIEVLDIPSFGHLSNSPARLILFSAANCNEDGLFICNNKKVYFGRSPNWQRDDIKKGFRLPTNGVIVFSNLHKVDIKYNDHVCATLNLYATPEQALQEHTKYVFHKAFTTAQQTQFNQGLKTLGLV